jgi:AcrR family transcriptional regulator
MSDMAAKSLARARRPRRRLPPERRRETLVRAASELFAERGYDHVTLDEIAARAGVTKVIVYRHFDSKQKLYLALLAAHRDELLSTLAAGTPSERPLPARVAAVADAWFAYVQAHAFAWKMLFKDVTGDAEIEAFHAGMRASAREAITRLLGAESALHLDPAMIEPVAELLRSAMTGLALWWLDHQEVERVTLVQTILQTIWHGLASATGADASTGPLTSEH